MSMLNMRIKYFANKILTDFKHPVAIACNKQCLFIFIYFIFLFIFIFLSGPPKDLL